MIGCSFGSPVTCSIAEDRIVSMHSRRVDNESRKANTDQETLSDKNLHQGSEWYPKKQPSGPQAVELLRHFQELVGLVGSAWTRRK